MKKIETWFYGRNSTSHQELSRGQQLLECKRYAESHNMVIVEEFYDDGISGTTTLRKEWERMIEKMKKEQGVIVLTYAVDRISRNVKDSLLIEELFEECNSQLISITQPELYADESPTAILTRNMNYSVAQYHSDVTRSLVKRALNQKAERFEFTGGIAPYGYKIVDKHYVVDEYEAQAIKVIFQMIADGYTYRQVAEKLTSLGYVRRNSKPFDYRTCYNDFIRNQKYKGVYIYGRTKKSKRSNNYNYHQSRPIEEQKIYENAIPRIITDELWEQANSNLDRRKHTRNSRRKGEEYLLTSKIYCACGKRMYGNSRKSGNSDSIYTSYRCNSHDKLLTGDCSHAKELLRDDIDGYIINLLQWYLKKENSIEIIENVMNTVLESLEGNKGIEIQQAKNRIGSLTRQINNLLDTLALGERSTIESIVSRIKDLEAEKKTLQDKITALQVQESNLTRLSKEDVAMLLDEGFQLMSSEESQLKKMIVRKFIDKIVVDKDKIQVEYNLNFFMSHANSYCRLSTIVLRNELKRQYSPLPMNLELLNENTMYFVHVSSAKLIKQKKTTHVSTQVVRGLSWGG